MFERRTTIKLTERPPRLDESFLREVLDTLHIAFIAVQDGKDARLMPPDNLGEIIRRAVADSLQQFGIFVHISIAQPFADARDGVVHKFVRALFKI